MSQAFVKEGDAGDDLPERPVSVEPNYVTARGLQELRAAAAALVERRAAADAEQRRLLDRDLRYYEARLDSAILIEHAGRPPEDVRFGADVEVEDAAGPRRLRIVGEDEAAPERGTLAWSSPLARALIGARAGDTVAFGEGALRVLAVRYD